MLHPLKRLVQEATDTNLKSLYDAAVEESILPIADAFQSELSKIRPSHKSKLAQIGRYFAAEADPREATKFGILLLGVCGNRTDAPLLETLPKHGIRWRKVLWRLREHRRHGGSEANQQ